MKLAIFGDSITNGYLRDGVENRTILKDKIENLEPALSVALFGVNGEDTSEAMTRRQEVAAGQPDKILIFFGANDASLNHAVSPDEFEVNLLVYVAYFGNDKTVLLTPPYHNDQVMDSWRSNKRVETYREKTLSAAKKRSCQLIDIYQTMRQAESPNSLLQADGLHLSDVGYDLLAQTIVEALKKIQ